MSAPQHVTVTHHEQVALVTLDVQGRTMNVIDDAVLRELRVVVDAVLADPDVKGMVLASGKPGSFGGGADLTTLPALAVDPGAVDFLVRTHELMATMADATKPIVAAIDGYALGGALEVALGCNTILVTDGARLGLPESTLGLIPGGGGTQLVLRRLGAAVAAELMVTGRVIGAKEALDVRLADQVVSAETLVSTAIEVARGGAVVAWPHPQPDPAAVEAVISAAEAVRRPPSAPAREAIVDLIRIGLTEGRDAGLAAERHHFLELLRSEESAALIHLFHVETAAKRRFRNAGDRPGRIAVIGAGQMGAGIAATAVGHGVPAVVRDVDEQRIDEARTRAAAAGGAPGDWAGTTGWQGIAEADVVVEAVFELPELKRETLTLVDREVGEETLIATNTSAIRIAELASAVSRPERFLGTHFFSPVERMPLVELVPHDQTSPESVDRAGAMSRALGKIPVVVADSPGFFTSRVYARWLIEGLRLLLDGADPERIESEARRVGFPVGPLQASDEVTLELVLQASVTQVAERVLQERVDVPEVKSLLRLLIDAGVRGKRFGEGFYEYADGRRAGINPALASVIGAKGAGVAEGVAGERLLLAFVTESLACWDDGTLCHPDDGDLASVLGIGFPRTLGGPFHWTDRTGAAAVLDRCRRLDASAFPVGQTLPRLAGAHGRLSDEPRRDRPGQDTD